VDETDSATHSHRGTRVRPKASPDRVLSPRPPPVVKLRILHAAPNGGGAEPSSVTLMSGVRRRILEALATREKTISELARDLGFHQTTLRYHLGFLVSHGLVDEVEPQVRRGRGRPPTRYRVSRHAFLSGFPPRHFEILAEVALRTILEAGGESCVQYLADQGVTMARSMVGQLAVDTHTNAWTAETFERLILGDLFRRFGVTSEVVLREPDALTYRVFTCPFLEVAERFPNLVCDSLDRGFHRGLDDAMGVKTERLACMGHGDLYCEYRTAWSERNRDGVARPERDRGSASAVQDDGNGRNGPS